MKEVFGIMLTCVITMVLAVPLAKSIAAWLRGERSIWNKLAPLEQRIYKLCGIDPNFEMNWKQHLWALLTINAIWLVYAFVMLLAQAELFLNPDGNPSMSPDLALNTAVSFLVNCNLQHYSGESGLTYLTQIFVIAFLQFASAATGIAAAFVLFRALRTKVTDKLGNFFVFFTQSITRILLPLSVIVAIVLAFSGTPASLAGRDQIITLQGDTVAVSRGPAAAMIAIKHIGTNGGGWFGANSAHPLENPTYFTGIIELVAQILIPIALIFTLGFYLNRRKLSNVVFAVMTLGFVCLVIPAVISETSGSQAMHELGVSQPAGNMEGKEARFGAAMSAFWSIATTVISTGSVNSMHDSFNPTSGTMQLLAMMTNAFYGGCGAGMLNYFIFLIIAVFISGMMVGRTPELLGRKIEAREMKIAAAIAILHPLLILAFTALSSWLSVHHPNMNWPVAPASWLNNPGSHGFTEMLYEFTSSAANNGSGYEGLADNNIFWNLTTAFVLLLGRFLPIIGPIAIAGLLASKRYSPESVGTLRADSYTFGLMTFAVIVILAALAFFPALSIGPLAESLSLK